MQELEVTNQHEIQQNHQSKIIPFTKQVSAHARSTNIFRPHDLACILTSIGYIYDVTLGLLGKAIPGKHPIPIPWLSQPRKRLGLYHLNSTCGTTRFTVRTQQRFFKKDSWSNRIGDCSIFTHQRRRRVVQNRQIRHILLRRIPLSPHCPEIL